MANRTDGSQRRTKRKIVYYFNRYLDWVATAVIIDDMMANHSPDTSIVLLYCGGELKPCWTNRTGRNSVCTQCHFYRKNALRSFPSDVRAVCLSEHVDESAIDDIWDSELFEYTDSIGIRKLKYKGASIGYGALSSYISWTRNYEPVVNREFRGFFDLLLKQQILLKEAIDRVIDAEHPDEITVFNGRTADTRPVLDTAIERGLPLRVVETIRSGPREYRRVVIPNALPHNIETKTRGIEDLWGSSPVPVEEKERIANQFFEGRRAGGLTRDVRVYVDRQTPGLLPEGWVRSKRNIVVFLSSEDEFAAIGDEFDQLTMFPSQEVGIERILENIHDENVQFYLRIHPNLANVGYGYHRRLLMLPARFGNIVVVSADSAISTYSLLDNADKVVVFGSTVGVEACYWGKPVVLLGGSFYYDLDVAYIPRSEADLWKLLRADLAPRPRIGAIKYGYYLMDTSSYSERIMHNSREVTFLGKPLGIVLPHLRLLGSPLLFKLTAFLRFRMIGRVADLISREAQLTVPLEGR